MAKKGRKLLGSGSGKGTNAPKLAKSSAPLTVPGYPALTGAPDVVAARMNIATQGIMEMRQLKKNKSAGLRPPGKR
jgi:hypothetical protein